MYPTSLYENVQIIPGDEGGRLIPTPKLCARRIRRDAERQKHHLHPHDFAVSYAPERQHAGIDLYVVQPLCVFCPKKTLPPKRPSKHELKVCVGQSVAEVGPTIVARFRLHVPWTWRQNAFGGGRMGNAVTSMIYSSEQVNCHTALIQIPDPS